MTTTLSSKGRVVLPLIARSRLHLQPGAKLVCVVQGDSIILRAQNPKALNHEYIVDEVSGLKVVKKASASPRVTSAMVKTILS